MCRDGAAQRSILACVGLQVPWPALQNKGSRSSKGLGKPLLTLLPSTFLSKQGIFYIFALFFAMSFMHLYVFPLLGYNSQIQVISIAL